MGLILNKLFQEGAKRTIFHAVLILGMTFPATNYI